MVKNNIHKRNGKNWSEYEEIKHRDFIDNFRALLNEFHLLCHALCEFISLINRFKRK